MQNSLSVAVGTVLATLELVEAENGVVKDVHLLKPDNGDPNVIGFKLHGHPFHMTVTEPRPRRPTLRRVNLTLRESVPALMGTVGASRNRHPAASALPLTPSP